MARGTYHGSELVDRLRRATTALEMALMPEAGHELTESALRDACAATDELTAVVHSLPACIASAVAFAPLASE